MSLRTLFLYCSLCPVLLFGQAPHYYNYNTEHGLPSSETYDIHIDKNNVVWVLTDRGICTYNGYEFKTYTTQDGLSYNTNFKLYEDQNGVFWFTGFNGNLTVYKNGVFRPFAFNDSLKAVRPGLWPDGLLFDKDGIRFGFYVKDNYSIMSDIYKINLRSGTLETEAKPQPIAFGVGAESYRLYIYENGHFIEKNDQKLLLGNSIITKDNQLLFSSNEKLIKINLNNLKYETYKFEQPINSVNLLPGNKLFLCSGSGLFYFENSDLSQSPHQYFNGVYPTDIDVDQEGNYWISTLERGILMVPSFKVKNVPLISKNSQNEKILSLGALKEHLVFGTSHQHLYSVGKNFKTELVLNKNEIRSIIYVYVRGGSATFPHNYRLREIGKSIELSACIESPISKYLLLAELKNEHVMGCPTTGFEIFKDGLAVDSLNRNISFSERILCIKEDQNNTTWLGTINGLYYFSNYDYSFIKNASDESPLLNVRINDIKTDAQNNLWLATIGNGLIYKTRDTIFQLSSGDGLNSDLVNRIYVQGDSSAWVGSNKGLNHINYQFDSTGLSTDNIESYTIEDGLASDFINDLASWNGYIWAATNKGLDYFKEKEWKREFPKPNILLEEVIVDETNYHEQKGVLFKHDQNNISFKFTGIAYRKIKNNTFYRSQLDGRNVDTAWFYTDERNVRFTNLPPGNYTFRVQARNKIGEWGRPAEFPFSIVPHFVETPWFKILMTLTGVISAALLFARASRFQQRKEKQKRLLKEAQLKTREAELATLRNQMNPHFIFNVLNSIQNFIFKNDIPQANFFLSKFSKLIRDSLRYSRLDYISLEQEIQFLKSYLEVETMRFPDKFKFQIINNLSDEENFLIPPLLIQPLLENSIKHGFKNIDYPGHLEVIFSKTMENAFLNVFIKDNGSGMETSVENIKNDYTGQDKASFGIEIVRERLNLLNEELQCTAASISLINHRQKTAQENGITVELVIPVQKLS